MGYLEDIFEQALALDGEVAKPLEPALAWQRRADQLNEALKTARAAEEAAFGKLVQSVAAGKVPPSEVPAKAAQTWVYDSPSSTVVAQAVAACRSNTATAARNAAPAIFTALQARIAEVVDESAKLAASLPPGIDTEAKALRSRNGDMRHLETWTRLTALIGDWTAVFQLVGLMQAGSWVAGPAHPYDRNSAVVFQRYAKPFLLPGGYLGAKYPPELRLAAAQAAGAGPALIDWDTAVARWGRLDRRQRNYGSVQVVQTFDGMGNLVAEDRGPETAAEFQPAAEVT